MPRTRMLLWWNNSGKSTPAFLTSLHMLTATLDFWQVTIMAVKLAVIVKTMNERFSSDVSKMLCYMHWIKWHLWIFSYVVEVWNVLHLLPLNLVNWKLDNLLLMLVYSYFCLEESFSLHWFLVSSWNRNKGVFCFVLCIRFCFSWLGISCFPTSEKCMGFTCFIIRFLFFPFFKTNFTGPCILFWKIKFVWSESKSMNILMRGSKIKEVMILLDRHKWQWHIT